jgi:hypothetical protein
MQYSQAQVGPPINPLLKQVEQSRLRFGASPYPIYRLDYSIL